MKKMIALDLDNTLLNSQKEISEQNVATLRHLHEEGIKVVLATGRPINAIRAFITQLGLTGPEDFTLTFNGGLVINNRTGAHLFQTGLVKDDLVPVADFMQAHDLPLDVLDFDRVYEIDPHKQSQYMKTVKGIDFRQSDFAGLPGGDYAYAKAVLAIPAPRLTAIKDAVLAAPAIAARVRVVQSQPYILEFLPPRVNKALGLEHLLDHFDMTFRDLVAFGDADNDAEMLRAAGDGVAMANALPQIKKIADHQTLTNNEDGVAHYLKKEFAPLFAKH